MILMFHSAGSSFWKASLNPSSAVTHSQMEGLFAVTWLQGRTELACGVVCKCGVSVETTDGRDVQDSAGWNAVFTEVLDGLIK